MSDGLKPGGSPRNTRPVHVYEVPAGLAGGITSIGLVMLTAEEELQAHKRSRGDNARTAFELIKTCLVEVVEDGAPKKLSLADGTVDAFWNAIEAPVRQLVASAYNELHSAPEEATKSFLSSRKVRVG